jgi:hypothetical protein
MFYMNYFFSPFLSIHGLGGDAVEITYYVINVSHKPLEGEVTMTF